MEQKRLCPYCMGELPHAADSCVHCGKVFTGRNPAGCLPVGTVLAGRYTVGEMRSLDGEGILYRGVENLGCFRVTIKEYLPVTLSAERGADCILQPKTGSEVLFKTTRMDFADLYRALERITPATGLEAVLDVVEANNTVYAVMENLGGTPLDQWLEAQGAPLRPDDACAMLQPVFEGVAAMHKIGLVHRGICPENLRVMADGRCSYRGLFHAGFLCRHLDAPCGRNLGFGRRQALYAPCRGRKRHPVRIQAGLLPRVRLVGPNRGALRAAESPAQRPSRRLDFHRRDYCGVTPPGRIPGMLSRDVPAATMGKGAPSLSGLPGTACPEMPRMAV